MKTHLSLEYEMINVYGTMRARPTNQAAKAMCEIMHVKSISIEQLERFAKIDGISINVMMSPEVADKISEQIASWYKNS